MNDAEQKELVFMTTEELLKDAQDTDAVEKLFAEFDEEANKNVLDQTQIRRQEDWSILSHQVVGAETTP